MLKKLGSILKIFNNRRARIIETFITALEKRKLQLETKKGLLVKQTNYYPPLFQWRSDDHLRGYPWEAGPETLSPSQLSMSVVMETPLMLG